MATAHSPEKDEFEFVFTADYASDIPDDWYLVDIKDDDLEAPLPNQLEYEDDLILSDAGDFEVDGQISDALLVTPNEEVLGTTCEITSIVDAPGDPTLPSWNIVGFSEEQQQYPPRNNEEDVSLPMLEVYNEWDESSQVEDDIDFEYVRLHQHNAMDIYVSGQHKMGRKYDILGSRFRKKHRTKTRYI